jgi:hypothetical protein
VVGAKRSTRRPRHRFAHGDDSRDGGDATLRVPHALTVVVALAALLVPGASAESTGDLRTLVILATWGPQAFDPAEVRHGVFDDAEEFLQRSSFGQVSLHGDVTPWLNAYAERPTCPAPVHERVAPALSDPPTEAAIRAGYTPSSYDRVIYVTPRIECVWDALGVRREVFLNGVFSSWHVVHELGHTFGLAHAHGMRCTSAGACRKDEYGDPLSPMGRGLVDFSAYEKLTMGWIHEVAHAATPGTYRVGRPDALDAPPHALVIPTARGEYWLEQREGLSVRYVEADVPDDDLAASTMFVARAGESYTLAGVFSVRSVPVDERYANLEFAWTDRTPPTRPTLRVPARIRAGRAFRISWSTRENGSGVASCVLRVDGRTVANEQASASVVLAKRGLHRLAVGCTDRAGNESRRAMKRVRIV